MASKWKTRAKEARKRVRQMRKIIKTGQQILREREERIAQLESHMHNNLEHIAVTALHDVPQKRA